MKISIVTLNYNGSKETIELLKSLEDKDQTDSDFEMIVVDNASEEADFIHITTSQVVYPQVKIVRNSENLGFSGGNNVGIRQAIQNGADWVVLLNNDTSVGKGLKEHLKAILRVKTGVIGIPLMEENHKQIVYCGKIQWLKPTLIHITTCEVVYPQAYAIGGAMAIHRDVFEKIGFLDEKYFLYFEDADFSIRARKANIPISFYYDSLIYHNVSTSTKKLGSALLLRYHYRNALYFNLKNGPWYIKLAIWPWSWLIAIKQLIKLTINQDIEESKAILAGVIDFYKKRMGQIKS